MTAGLQPHSKSTGSPSEMVLYLALELSQGTWKLAFATGRGPSARRREVAARDIPALLREIREAKRKLRVVPEAPVVSCYEAGRDGFWLHRCLAEQHVQNLVIDSSSIEVNRRSRRAKSDGLDVEKLLSLLLRYAAGEKRVFSIVQVPTPEEEDARQLHRELQTLEHESTRHINRLKGLLASLGLALEIDKHFPQRLSELRQWNGQAVPAGLRQRLLHEFERLAVVNRQIRELARLRSQTLKRQSSPQIEQVKQLLGLRAIGVNGAWLLVQLWKYLQTGVPPTGAALSDWRKGISSTVNRLDAV
jgi:transposase